MMTTAVKRMIAVVTILVFAGVAFAVQNAYSVTKTETKAATRAAATKATQAAPQTVKINIYVLSEAEAEFTLTLEKIDKAAADKDKPNPSITKNVTIRKGVNCITYDKGKKGQYRVTLTAYGDPLIREVTAVQGEYSLFYAIAPPQDGDAKKKVVINQLDLSAIKEKK